MKADDLDDQEVFRRRPYVPHERIHKSDRAEVDAKEAEQQLDTPVWSAPFEAEWPTDLEHGRYRRPRSELSLI